jgi:hypothetical protein
VRWCHHASCTVISPTSKLGPWRPLRSVLGLVSCAFGSDVGFRLYELSPYPSLEFIHSPVRDCSRCWNWFCVPGSAIYRGGSGLVPPPCLSLSPHISSCHPPKPVNTCTHSLSRLFCALLSNLQDGFGGLVVRGFKPSRSRWIFTSVKKNPQPAFLRRGSKSICPMSQLCGM